MASQKVVEVELEEIALVEEHTERENVDEQETKADTEEKTADEGNVYSTLTNPSEYVYGAPSSTRSYTVNKVTDEGLQSPCARPRTPQVHPRAHKEPSCGQVRTNLLKGVQIHLDSLTFVELRRVSINMYVKLCNFGKSTDGKPKPKPLPPDSDSSDIYQRVRVYRVVSLVLLVICVLLLIVVIVLFIKLTGMHSCQPTETTLEQECTLKKCQEVYQQPFEKAQGLCRDCGSGWLRFENTCYFLSETRLTWQKSREECQRKGGDLAVITNERVQMFLKKRALIHYWIGLSLVGTNQWMWINNTVLTVRYWGDSSSSGECGIMVGEKQAERSWQPAPCRLNLQYICQKM